MHTVVTAKEIDAKAWNALAQYSPVASWFQTIEAYDFFNGLSFLEVFVYGVLSEGQLKGVVVGYVQKDGGRIKRFLSRRAIILGGPMLSRDITEAELSALLNVLKMGLKKKAIYIEMRNFNDYTTWRNVFELNGFDYEPHFDIWVNTSAIEVVDENLGKSRKRDIRASFRNEAALVFHPTLAQVREYYSILKKLYLTKVKTPLFPIEFFEKLYKLDSAAFLLVEYDGKIVGGTVCVGLPGQTLYEMYACGMDSAYKKIFPSEMATYAGLKYAAENTYSRFDMMGAGKPEDKGYGVRDFKLKFGGELMELGRYVHVCNRLLFSVGKFGVKIIKSI